MDIKFLDIFGGYNNIKSPRQMIWKYIASQHKKNKNKSILPPSFGKRSQYVLSRILYNQKLQEKNSWIQRKGHISLRVP